METGREETNEVDRGKVGARRSGMNMSKVVCRNVNGNCTKSRETERC